MVENDVSKKRPKEAFTQRVMDAIVVGRVISLGGKPIHGASIEIREHAAGTHGRELQTQIHTDTDGRYRYPITAPEQSIYSLRAKHPEFEESQESRFAVETAGELSMTDLVLKSPQVRTVRGKVTDESGNPIEGAFLCSIYHRFEKGDENAAATDAAGEYTIDRWVNDRPLLYAKADGYTTGVAHLDLTNYKSFSMNFVLKPAVNTSGRVVDENGAPVEQVYVGFYYPRQQHGILDPWSTYTDADGRFCISSLPEGAMRIKASHDDYHETDDWQEITSGDTDVELILRPLTLAKIHGQVVDAETGSPIPDFTYFTDRPYEPSEDRETARNGLEEDGCHVTSKSGEFTTKALDIDCELDVIVTADGYAPFRIGNVVVGCGPLRFPLEPGKTVLGRVFDSKTVQPIANATVSHFCAECPLVDIRDVEGLIWYGPSSATYRKQGGQSSVTDATGHFVLNTLGRMGSCLYIEPPDDSQHAPSVVRQIEFDDGVSEIEMVIMCNTGGAIRGNVPELPVEEIAHYRDFYIREGTPIESVWLVSDEIPHLKIKRGLMIASGKELNLEEMDSNDPIEIPANREVAFPHIMSGRWLMEHCTHHPDFFAETEVFKAGILQIEEGETITEPFKSLTHDGGHEPEIQPERLDFGTVCSDSVVEARIVLHGELSISSSTMPTWLRFDTAWLDSWGRWRIDITANTTTIGTHSGTIRFQTDTGEFTLPTSISVIESGSPSQKILWTDTPFNGLSGMSTALIDELIRSHHLDIDFTSKIPRNLDLYQTIVLVGDTVCNIWQEDVMRLQNFVEAGGRLVVGANAFYCASVEGLNKIVHTYGFKMLDIEPIGEVNVELDAAQFPNGLAT